MKNFFRKKVLSKQLFSKKLHQKNKGMRVEGEICNISKKGMRVEGSKGQYLIISEILLFALGILITANVVVSFQSIQSSLSKAALKDQFGSVADVVSTAVVKAATTNSSIAVIFPTKISEKIYVISLKDESIIVYDLDAPDINVTKKLFNITQSNCITEGIFCAAGDVVSTVGRAEVYIDGRTIKIRRA